MGSRRRWSSYLAGAIARGRDADGRRQLLLLPEPAGEVPLGGGRGGRQELAVGGEGEGHHLPRRQLLGGQHLPPPRPLRRQLIDRQHQYSEQKEGGQDTASLQPLVSQPSPKSFVLALDPPFHSLRRRSQGSHQSWAASQKSSQSHPGSPCAHRARVAERKGKGQLVMRRTRSQRAHSNKPPLNKSGFLIIS